RCPSVFRTFSSPRSFQEVMKCAQFIESPWCLAELVLMLQSQARIIPLFNDVQPGVLRHIEKGVYAEAFTDYEKKGRHLEKLQEWKEALQSVSFITGEEFHG
ncbi:hypothetical protein KI387_034395, partial [Taxus chinensis]